MRNVKRTFTLVELLVVIGIIALLISILLPALSKARESANTIKCAANLRSIGEGVASYIANYHGAIPASNVYYGLQILNGGTQQLPPTPTQGYVHWSSYLYGGTHDSPSDPVFQSIHGWEMFQCPSLQNGGIPPANTFAGNNDIGLSNEAGPGAVDLPATRLSYMLNEALTPRSIFVKGFRSRTAAISFRYRRACAPQRRDHFGHRDVGNAKHDDWNLQHRRVDTGQQQPPTGQRN